MKRPIAIAVTTIVMAWAARGQGTVNFRNYFGNLATDPKVFFADGVTGVWGEQYLAGLMAGPGPGSMPLVATTHFFAQPWEGGYFVGPAVAIPGVAGGAEGFFEVRVWDSTLNGTTTDATFQQAVAFAAQTGQVNIWGESSVFTEITGNPSATPPGIPADLTGLQSFTLGWSGGCGCFYGFTVQPESQTAVVGTRVIFEVEAAADPPPAWYQWYFNGNPIIGANSRQYVIASAELSDAGSYSAAAYNVSWGTHYSTTATLTFLMPPLITDQPQSRTAEAGATASFSAQFTSTNPATSQWFFNQTNRVPGGTNSLLWLSGLTPAQAGFYTVVISNIAGSVVSAPAALSVISSLPRRLVPALEVGATPGTGVNLEFATTLNPPLIWQPLAELTLSNTTEFYCDFSFSSETKFYRAWQTGASGSAPGLELRLAPAIALSGRVGQTLWLEGINMVGPTDAWFPVATLVLTNILEYYPDVSSIGQPPRLWRIIAGPSGLSKRLNLPPAVQEK